MNIALIVTDARPLITLAVADALDTLKLLGTRIVIPDMVHFEVTRYADKPGARTLLAWVERNRQLVELAATEEFAEFQALLAFNPTLRTRNRGEMAAAEVLAAELEEGIDAGLLLFEDSDIRKANFLVRLPDSVLILSTPTFCTVCSGASCCPMQSGFWSGRPAVRGMTAHVTGALTCSGAAHALDDWGIDTAQCNCLFA